MIENVSAILKFWFGEDKNNLLSNTQKWWSKDPEFDSEIRERFGKLIPLAREGKLEDWVHQPQSCLAYIILQDQFSRNAYRGTPLAFAQDDLALKACEYGREHKLDRDLNIVYRQFFYMPLEHSEEINHQRLCLALMQQLVHEARETSPQYLHAMEEAFAYAQKHYDIIQNFGRFPHRNNLLERESTQAEILFLQQPGSNF